MTIQKLRERLKLEIGITREIKTPDQDNLSTNWNTQYKQGFIDGIERSLELSIDKN